MSKRWILAAAAAVVIGLVKVIADLAIDASPAEPPRGQPPAVAPAEGTYQPAAGAELDELLDQVDVIPDRPTVPGYDRECGTGHACSFGQTWSDDVDVEGGRNGCDTRNDILARDLDNTQTRPGTNGCVIISGTLDDPFTGESIDFTKEKAYEVGVDHLYPLARAWDLGAAEWSPQQRQNFANDPRNLAAVSGAANSSKGDSGPGEWLPINSTHRCTYVADYLSIAIAYSLPVTAADHDAAAALEDHCAPTNN
ncbi:HNH endonuclease family protein [Nocardioides sp. NPDC057764]|uniref:HNH endonuclease family protein n=1 Tax=Nocardioides sp. NPDC057764 TaxID=3346243 RepID=UPI00367302C9